MAAVPMSKDMKGMEEEVERGGWNGAVAGRWRWVVGLGFGLGLVLEGKITGGTLNSLAMVEGIAGITRVDLIGFGVYSVVDLSPLSL